jgi:hypothetical protein
MDQTVLVKDDRDIGAQVLEALSRVKLSLTLGEWIYWRVDLLART